MRAVSAFLAIAVATTAVAKTKAFAEPGMAPEAITPVSLVDGFRDAFFLGCMLNATGKLSFVPENIQELRGVGLSLGLPGEYDAVRQFDALFQLPGPMQFATRPVLSGAVLLAEKPLLRLCQIQVLDASARDVRDMLTLELTHPDAPWKLEEDKVRGDVRVQSYRWEIDGPTDINVTMSGPPETIRDGHGLQLLVTVAQVKD